MEEVSDECVFYVGRCGARNVLLVVGEHVLVRKDWGLWDVGLVLGENGCMIGRWRWLTSW